MDDIVIKLVGNLEKKFVRKLNKLDKKVAQLEKDSAEHLRVSQKIYEQNVVLGKEKRALIRIIEWYEKRFGIKREDVPIENL